MSLQKEIAEQNAIARRYPAKMAILLDELGSESTELKKALADRTIKTTAILRALNARGFSISEPTVRRYRESLWV